MCVLQSGDMKITNHTTKDECNLKFQAYSYFSRERQRKVGKLGGRDMGSVVWGEGPGRCGLGGGAWEVCYNTLLGPGTRTLVWKLVILHLNLWPRSLEQSAMQLVLLCTLSMVTGMTILRPPRSYKETRKTRLLNPLCRCGRPHLPSKPIMDVPTV